ncbi:MULTISPECIES: penicillin-binding protein 2 [unclassified Actinomyces]|uniref:peptidoglycan D,D-transpeptidase FtsI family protein n=1 Tax=unclassified Actinomyces TaxID=2609248 RepID=UPI0020182651|nr:MULTISPECIES: penicillin-binding protein 2 [unclassified Actinomyces]MCL3777354.1 penicillin-binding protein 2 [Actinomyces sp. AC-20-1]MCL3790677.1 penicillin-binding protein 2 [Actinomyces sp. 187325]MCL3792988.1 penicillin-binding protein 2 [Actinomyces sp. 186855]MCL3793491.1 penicillin-binding protein 2 [Actinomyces sp. 217892]
MNRQIHQVTVLVLVMFLALAASVTSVQGLARPALWEASSEQGTLVTDPRNSRTIFAQYGTNRGQIIAGGTVIADSQPVDDAYAYQRLYTGGDMYSHVTGYFSTAFASMTGLEQAENSVLNGDDPSLLSSRLKALVTGGSTSGGSVELTIDPQVQQAAWDALAGRRGAVVALDPSTGAVLAMVSSPSYDANLLASHDTDAAVAAYSQLQDDEAGPLLNRAIAGDLYPPGSTFKILTLAAALRAGTLGAETEVAAPDSLTLPGTSHELMNYAGESCGNGTVTVAYAFAESCNTPFAQMAMDLGDAALAQEAQAWGFGARMSVPLAVTPSVYPANADAAQTAMAGIGQASVRATPLMMALVAATVANGGEQMTPYLVARTLDSDLNIVSTTTPSVARTPVSSQTAAALASLMTQAVAEGTGASAQVPGVSVAGKTGTAETGSDVGGPVTWFIGFAGTDPQHPSIALAVVLDGGEQTAGSGTGGSVAGPVAAAVIDAAVDQ